MTHSFARRNLHQLFTLLRIEVGSCSEPGTYFIAITMKRG
jgi:hypothetical protein